MESTVHTEKWEGRISRPCGLVKRALRTDDERVCCKMYKQPRGEHAVQSKERVYLVRVTMLPRGEHAARATTEYHQHKRSRGELAVRTLRESWREHIRLLPRWTVTGALVKSVSLSHLHEGERERHTYTAATEVVSVASPLFSRDAARCCRAVAAPRVDRLGCERAKFKLP